MKLWVRCVIAVGMALGVASAYSQTVIPKRVVVPFPPGGLADTVARKLSAAITAVHPAQTWIIENKAGASGALGTNFVAQSKNDGLTLLVSTVHALVNYENPESPSYTPAKFKKLATLAYVPSVLVVSPKGDIATGPQWIAAAKQQPSKFAVATSGIGNHDWVIADQMIKFGALRGVTWVPHRSSGQSLDSVISYPDQTMVAVVPWDVAQEHERAGRLRILAVFANQRLSVLPGVPTYAEAQLGPPSCAVALEIVVAVRRDLSSSDSQQLQQMIQKAMETQKYQEDVKTNGAVRPRVGPQQMPGSCETCINNDCNACNPSCCPVF